MERIQGIKYIFNTLKVVKVSKLNLKRFSHTVRKAKSLVVL